MNLHNINNQIYLSNNFSKFDKLENSKDAKKKDSAANTSMHEDVIYETSNKEIPTSIKNNPKVDPETIAKLKADADQRLSQLKGIVEELFTKQGTAVKNADIWNQFRQGVLDGTIEIDPAVAEQAAKDVSEDGYWGVEQTSERILDFAKALTGNDPSKVEELRDAIQKGFDEAEKLWGDKLPEISQDTHEAVMKGLDEWVKEEQEEASEETDEHENNK